MASSQELTGILVALATPYKNDQSEVDYDTLDHHIDYLIDSGVHGLVPGGSTGEFTALSDDERKKVLEQVIASAKGRHAAKAGAAALMVVPPFYEGPNLQELRSLLEDVRDASKLPIVYYNIPSASGVSLTPLEMASLSEVGVTHLKDTSGNGPALTQLLFQDSISDKITSFNGWDTLTFYGLAAGAKGSIWGASNFIPELSVALWNAIAVEGDIKKGREIWRKIYPITQVLESNNYCAAVKTALELTGWKIGGIRKPFAMLEGKPKDDLARALKAAGVKIVE
ncbi:hypothetical protein NW762_005735 [Fusarium torreyae]|uniref:Dihydrodipicolinate synthase n=1 Tax=Fusarium torreyae TaxID=1237075 RepID=A0A9W8S5M0_9HYPO|nr:hypothetical protein NW762_005735 [Fusarium torreyae]